MSSLQKLYAKIDSYQSAIGEIRPLKPQEVKELMEYYRIGLTYTSNALEGNTLTLSETKVLLEDGITAGGKPLRDCYEAVGHSEAYSYMLDLVKRETFELQETDVLKLHRLFYMKIDEENAGAYRTIQNFITGTEYVPPEPERVPTLMERYLADINRQAGKIHPVELAALAHLGLVTIHPFVDGDTTQGHQLKTA